tara:strand:- start:32 stop:268 length:237 start_codon:yes stop_codon:yes gene_type:complete
MIKLKILLQDISDYAKTFGGSKIAHPVFPPSPRTDATKNVGVFNGTIVQNNGPKGNMMTSYGATNFSRDSGSVVKEER